MRFDHGVADRFVLDAGVALAWVLDEEPAMKRYAAAVYEYASEGRIVCVPALFHQEVAAVMLRGSRREKGRVRKKRVDEFFARLECLNIETITSLDLARELFDLGNRYHLQGFDAVYFHLAVTQKHP